MPIIANLITDNEGQFGQRAVAVNLVEVVSLRRGTAGSTGLLSVLQVCCAELCAHRADSTQTDCHCPCHVLGQLLAFRSGSGGVQSTTATN